MGRRFLTGSNLVLAALLLMLVTILSNTLLTSTRIDLTEQKLYTLTEGSKKIVGNLSDTVVLQLFFSDNLLREVAPIKSYALRVKELLQEYANHSNGKLVLKVIDPEPFSEEEDRAVQFGLRGVPINEVGDQAYFGLAATNNVDGEEVIAFFSPDNEDVVEYEISRLIYNLDHPARPRIGIISSHMVNGTPPGPRGGPPGPGWVFYSQMQGLFDTRMILNELAVVPKEYDLLLVIHPNRLSDTSLSAIDQYLLAGGKAVIFLDPLSEVEVGPPNPLSPNIPEPKLGSDLSPLLEAWGLQLDRLKVVGDKLAARRVMFSRDPTTLPEEFLPWLSLGAHNFNHDDVITSKLTSINMASAGAIKMIGKSSLTLVPLIETSDQAMEIDASKVETSPNPKELMREFVASGEKYVLAARLTGKTKSAYPAGPPPRIAREGAPELPEIPPGSWLKESSAPMNVVLVADSDLLHDRFWVRVQEFYGERMAEPYADNGAFLINALDNLSGSSDLINVRSRAAYARPFQVVIDLTRKAEDQFLAKEKELQQKLRETEAKLGELQKKNNGEPGDSVGVEPSVEIGKFLQEKVGIRKQLRDVQRDLRKDIESLETSLKFINIGLIPLLIGLAGLLVSVARLRR